MCCISRYFLISTSPCLRLWWHEETEKNNLFMVLFFECADTECTNKNKHQMAQFLNGVNCENQNALTIFRVCLRNLVVGNNFLNILRKHSSLNINPENKVYENWSSLEWKKGAIQQQRDKSGKAIKNIQ